MLPWDPLAPTGHDVLPAAPEALPPQAYVAKVKNLLSGLQPTDGEVSAVRKDPEALRGLIMQWTALPEYRAKMLDFFRNAFQQNHVQLAALQNSVGLPGGFMV